MSVSAIVYSSLDWKEKKILRFSYALEASHLAAQLLYSWLPLGRSRSTYFYLGPDRIHEYTYFDQAFPLARDIVELR